MRDYADDSLALSWLILAYLQKGDFDKARDFIEKIPKEHKIYLVLARCLYDSYLLTSKSLSKKEIKQVVGGGRNDRHCL